MLTIAFLVLFSVMALRITKTIVRESAIFREFKQSRTLLFLVWLFPVGSLALMISPNLLGWLPPLLLALACYLPAMVVARRVNYVFEQAGTDRVKRAQNAVSQAFGIGLVGIVYVAGVFVITIGSVAISS